ncbi:translation initiation factor eIF-2B subunit alpha [Neophaeococcomyces mojaviensis]|uniref:Translation initiation factor eIF-2B subunit alpha n=1 Tax=Neophaeococcomyces mojaviensis TaxID=3383035 RepID=A0ACC3AAX3_9EURO|nr:translation initiation factor eIF-2B subunit alpha [Knufia sp. JES_112]
MTSSSPAGLATPPPERLSAAINPQIDVVSHYKNLIATDPSITPAIAAIESLVAALTAQPLTTITETLTLLSTTSTTLLASRNNPIPLSAGTELLQRYIITSFQNNTNTTSADFSSLRRQLIQNSKLFISRTKSARSKIAQHALPFIRDDATTVITYGSSRVIDAILSLAAESRRYFHVIFVNPSSGQEPSDSPFSQSTNRLLSLGIPVATVPLAALSHTIASIRPSNARTTSSNLILLLGAEAVLENGAAISNIGSRLVSAIAHDASIPVYFAVESYKFTRQFPLNYGDSDLQKMGAKQSVLKFRTSLEEDEKSEMSFGVRAEKASAEGDGTVDITPPELINALITENGTITADAVAEELIKLWF